MNSRQKQAIRNKVEQTFKRERITDLRRLFNAVRDEWFPEGIVNKNFIMSCCAYQIRNNS
jgi:hypothetical protein